MASSIRGLQVALRLTVKEPIRNTPQGGRDQLKQQQPLIRSLMTRAWEQTIRDNRQAVLDRWTASVMAMLPGGLSHVSLVAGAIAEELGGLLDAIADSSLPASEPIVRITRILAVQDIPPSKALSILFGLRGLVEGLPPESGELFRDRLEELTLQTFDSYMKHREAICQLKVDEGRRRMHMALRRAEA